MHQIEAELAAGADDPQEACRRMSHCGSFYSYAGAGSSTRRGVADASPMDYGIQVLPRSSAANYPPPSPIESDSAEYEQPISAHHRNSFIYRHDEPRDSMVHASSRMRLIRDDADDDILTDAEFDDIATGDLLYSSRMNPQPGTSGCLLHGPSAIPQEPAPSLPPPIGGPDSLGSTSGSQFWFDDITWGRSPCWVDDFDDFDDDDDGE